MVTAVVALGVQNPSSNVGVAVLASGVQSPSSNVGVAVLASGVQDPSSCLPRTLANNFLPAVTVVVIVLVVVDGSPSASAFALSVRVTHIVVVPCTDSGRVTVVEKNTVV